jgi:two-component system, cell cycle sensor histidine kinase and response regulator CckA
VPADDAGMAGVEGVDVARAVAALSDGVVLTDPALPDHPIVWTNDAFLELTGYRRDEVVGRNCRFLQGPLTDAGAVDRIRTAIADRTHFHEAILNYRKDGSAFWNALTVSPVLDAEGRLVNFVAAQSDISHVKLLEEQIRHAEKIELVGRMAGGIAHDFNNVLTAFEGYLSLLELEVDADPGRGYLDELQQAATRAKRLTDRLLAFSRKREAVAAAVDVNDVVDGLRGLLDPLLRGSAELVVELSDEPLPVLADVGELEQVIVNLVVNARDAGTPGGVVRLSTAASDAGGEPLVVVADEGVGMDEETKARIFEPFFTTKGEGRGTGLGLANVLEIVRGAGGRVEVDSAPGRGSTFVVSLPRAS